MICPHCNKLIASDNTIENRKKIISLRDAGFSYRQIEVALAKQGVSISYSTIARIIKNNTKKEDLEVCQKKKRRIFK